MRRAILTLLSIPWLIFACSRYYEPPGSFASLTGAWQYTDLRWIDPSDTSNPTQDLVAVYIRRSDPWGKSSLISFPSRAEWQVRLELLEVEIESSVDIYLALDHAAGGESKLPGGARAELEWDTLLVVPASGALHAWDSSFHPRNDLALRVLRNPELDTIDIALHAAGLPGLAGLRFQIFTFSPGGLQPLDASSVISAYGAPPPVAQVLFAFWDVLPAYTPAQALRRWDGAHTGPYGGRHGLYNLLRIARNHRTPLALLDLKNPLSLSALDALDGVKLVGEMAASGLLILPEMQTTSMVSLAGSTLAANLNRQAGLDFDLPASAWVYLPEGGSAPPGYHGVFLPLSSVLSPQATLYRQAEMRWLVFSPTLPVEQASPAGPSLEVRRLLVDAAVRAGLEDRSEILVLGGSLPESAWGDPISARQSFRYLASRPWIHPLSSYDLLAQAPTRLAGKGSITPVSSATLTTSTGGSKLPLPFSYDLITLYAPVWPSAARLPELRARYAGQQEILLAAQRWFSNLEGFALNSGCYRDLDRDGQPECMLVSSQVLAVFDPFTGALTYLFVLSEGQLHQIIGPSSQLALGLSDPSTWDLSAGLLSDPTVIPGAFAVMGDLPQAAFQGERLVFLRPGLEQAYNMLPAGLQVEIKSVSQQALQIPFLLDPWERFTPGWTERFQSRPMVNGWELRWISGPRVIVQSNAPQSVITFADALPLLARTENPNLDYPPGHYLPMPLALVELSASEALNVRIELSGD